MIAARRQVIREYLAEATTLVWKMQRVLSDEPGGSFAIPKVIMADAHELMRLSGIIEAMAASEALICQIYEGIPEPTGEEGA